MSQCNHEQIVVITESAKRLRCRHCHLTIKEEDLTDGTCPECYETEGRRHTDFEEVFTNDAAEIRYRCEICNAWLNPATETDAK